MDGWAVVVLLYKDKWALLVLFRLLRLSLMVTVKETTGCHHITGIHMAKNQD